MKRAYLVCLLRLPYINFMQDIFVVVIIQYVLFWFAPCYRFMYFYLFKKYVIYGKILYRSMYVLHRLRHAELPYVKLCFVLLRFVLLSCVGLYVMLYLA